MDGPENYYVGLDISTSVVGIAILDGTGKSLVIDHVDLRKLEPDLMLKGESFRLSFDASFRRAEQVTGQVRSVTLCVEERLGNFTRGMTTMQTLMALSAFNGIVSYISYRKFLEQFMSVSFIRLHPSTVKKLVGLRVPKGADKKRLAFELSLQLEPDFPRPLNRNGKLQPYVYDMADAYLTARAGLCSATKS